MAQNVEDGLPPLFAPRWGRKTWFLVAVLGALNFLNQLSHTTGAASAAGTLVGSFVGALFLVYVGTVVVNGLKRIS